jgi:hypothetical protein
MGNTVAATGRNSSVRHKDVKRKRDSISVRHCHHRTVKCLPDVMIKVKMKFVRKRSGMTAKRKATVE